MLNRRHSNPDFAFFERKADVRFLRNYNPGFFEPSTSIAWPLTCRVRGIDNPTFVRAEPGYLAITTVVQELLSLGRSRLPAMRIRSDLRFPRTMGQ